MGFVPLLSTDILIRLFLYSQPLPKEKEQNKKGKGEKQVQFSPHFLCHSSVIDLGFDKFLWWQCPSQLKVSRLNVSLFLQVSSRIISLQASVKHWKTVKILTALKVNQLRCLQA